MDWEIIYLRINAALTYIVILYTPKRVIFTLTKDQASKETQKLERKQFSEQLVTKIQK